MRHHYVPQFLLRPWAENTADQKIEVFRLDLDHVPSSRRSPKHTAYEQDLYALSRPVIAGMEKQAIEKQFLKHIDNLGAHVRCKLEDQGLRTLTLDDRVDWARFLMSLRLRQPSIVDMLRQESAEHLRATLATQPEQYEELAGIGDPPTLEAWTEKNFPGLVENFGLSFFHELVDNPRLGEKILSMKWWMWDFSDVPHDLLLADEPCIFTSGIDEPNLVIALPIAPKRAFMATQSDRVANVMRRQRPNDLATRLNESSVAQARVRVYARNQSPERFIGNRRQRRRSPTER
jgi:hypothetical protein